MLTIAAARLEQDRANPLLVTGLREEAKRLAKLRAEGRAHTSEDEKRIARQRNLFTMLPVYDAKERLREAMLQRAYDLLWDGDSAGCDAICEFLPADDVEKMLDAWSADQENVGEKSKWY